MLDAVSALLESHVDVEETSALCDARRYDEALRAAFEESGFFELGREAGWLEAAMLVEATAQAGGLLDIGAAVLVAPALSDRPLPGPIALVSQQGETLVRFGAHARTALVDLGDDARIVSLDPGAADATETNFSWPIGRIALLHDLVVKHHALCFRYPGGWVAQSCERNRRGRNHCTRPLRDGTASQDAIIVMRPALRVHQTLTAALGTTHPIGIIWRAAIELKHDVLRNHCRDVDCPKSEIDHLCRMTYRPALIDSGFHESRALSNVAVVSGNCGETSINGGG